MAASRDNMALEVILLDYSDFSLSSMFDSLLTTCKSKKQSEHLQMFLAACHLHGPSDVGDKHVIGVTFPTRQS